MTQYDWLSKWSHYSPQKIAIKEFESSRTLTYHQFNNVSLQVAAKILNVHRLNRGDRVAILAENCLEYVMLFSAAQKTGIILVPLNYRLAAREIDYLLQDSQPSLIIFQEKFQAILDACKSVDRIPHKWTLEEMKASIYPKRNISIDFFTNEALSEDDPIFILYTAGTTGFPKGALYTHKMLFWNSINTTMRLDIMTEDRSVSCTPMFHTGGWNVIPTPFLHRGAYFCLTQKFDPDIIIQLLEKEQATMFMGVPTMVKMMAQSPLFDKVNLSKMRFFVIGGEPMPIPLIEKWHDKGVPIRQGYGMTEAGPSITSLHQSDAIRKKGSIGIPNFYIDARIVDEEEADVTAGEIGELILKGPSVTPGYWNNPDATKRCIKNGWLYTGDLVKQDSEGYLYVVDRKKFMFISGGENVYPTEIERFLHTHQNIEDVAVIGVPDEKWGEVGKAFIVVKAGTILKESDVIKFCKGNLAKYKIPKYIKFVEALPKTDAGKIDRKKLAIM